MNAIHGEVGIDVERLRAADPDGLYLFMLEDYPYMMTSAQVAEFTCSFSPPTTTLTKAWRPCSSTARPAGTPTRFSTSSMPSPEQSG